MQCVRATSRGQRLELCRRGVRSGPPRWMRAAWCATPPVFRVGLRNYVRVLGQVAVQSSHCPTVGASGDDDRPMDRVQSDASPGTRQSPRGDVLLEFHPVSAAMDVQGLAGGTALDQLIRSFRCDAGPQSAHRTRAGRISVTVESGVMRRARMGFLLPRRLVPVGQTVINLGVRVEFYQRVGLDDRFQGLVVVAIPDQGWRGPIG